MKTKLKKSLIIMLVIVFNLTFLTACGTRINQKEYGYFVYADIQKTSQFFEGEKGIYILGLTEEGKEQTVLDVPAYINNKPVRNIGLNDGWMTYEIASQKTEYLYFSRTTSNLYFSIFGFPHLKKLINASVDEELQRRLNGSGEYIDVYTPKKAYQKFCIDYPEEVSDRFRPANVSFYFGYKGSPNLDYYRVDQVEAGESVPKVPDPERDGYTFGGWYTVVARAGLFDFDSYIMEEGELELYAKWTKNG